MIRLALCTLALALSGAASAETPDLTGTLWSVCGDDGIDTWHDTRLMFTVQTETADGIRLEGHFDWQSSGGHWGRELVSGLVTPEGALTLQGSIIEDGSASIVVSRYEGQLTPDGTRIVDGVWLDGAPGIWAATRDGGAGTGVSLCDTAVPIS